MVVCFIHLSSSPSQLEMTDQQLQPHTRDETMFWNMLRLPSHHVQKTACSDYGRHCPDNGEQNHNVFDRPSNTLPECVADANGEFGSGALEQPPDGSSSLVVEFEYQVQTTLSQTPTVLEAEDSALRRVERSVSDALVEIMFSGTQCTVPPVVMSGDKQNTTSAAATTEDPDTRWRRRRDLQGYSYWYQLTGFQEEPVDAILPGTEGGA